MTHMANGGMTPPVPYMCGGAVQTVTTPRANVLDALDVNHDGMTNRAEFGGMPFRSSCGGAMTPGTPLATPMLSGGAAPGQVVGFSGAMPTMPIHGAAMGYASGTPQGSVGFASGASQAWAMTPTTSTPMVSRPTTPNHQRGFGGAVWQQQGTWHADERGLRTERSSLQLATLDTPPAAVQVVEMPGMASLQCVCGNWFMDDSIFCRKCGMRRSSQAQNRSLGMELNSNESMVTMNVGKLETSQRYYDVPRPMVQEVVKEVARDVTEHHTVIREAPQLEMIEKRVEVPMVHVSERVVEVPATLVQEEIVEVPRVVVHEQIRQVAKVEYQDKVKQVAKPVHEPRDRVVEVPHPLVQERLVEVPQMHVVDCVREVVRPHVQHVQKQVAKPVVQCHERLVEVPMTTVREQIVEVPRVEYVECMKQVPKHEVQRVEKLVQKPEVHLVEQIEEVPEVEIREEVIEVPQTEVREYVRQVPVPVVRYIEKQVAKPRIEWIEKVVEVPQIVYEEKIVEVPEVEVMEVIRQVAVPVVQYIDKQVPKAVMNYFERVVDVPTVLQEEKAVEVPQHQAVEVVTQMPRPTYQAVPKEVPKVVIQPQEKIIEQPVPLRQDQISEVPQVQYADLVTQVLNPQIEYVDKPVPLYETQAVEKVVEVPHVLVEERLVEVPQLQVAEVVKEELQPVVQEVVKEVPRHQIEYVEKVVEVQSQLMQEHTVNGTVQTRSLGINIGQAPQNVFVQEARFKEVEPRVSVATTSVSTAPTGMQAMTTSRRVQEQRFVERSTAAMQSATWDFAGAANAGLSVAGGSQGIMVGVEASQCEAVGTACGVEVEARAGQSTQCVCGNWFMDDSVFCRKCGQRRSQVAYGTGYRSSMARGGSTKVVECGAVNGGAMPASVAYGATHPASSSAGYELSGPASLGAAVAVVTNGEGRADFVVLGADRNCDGIPDVLQSGGGGMVPVGFDVNGDGRADFVVGGVDANRDGIPDALQVAQRSIPGPVNRWPGGGALPVRSATPTPQSGRNA